MYSEKKFLNGYSGCWDAEKIIKKVSKDDGESFYLCNLSDIIKKFDDWNEKMPRVKPFYAVKCNDEMGVIKTLASIGCSFDCASAGEISKVLSLNVDPERIIFANTTKMPRHIEYAKANNVSLMTFDNKDELLKIAKLHADANLVLRIRYSSNKAKYDLGKKFGCDPKRESPQLLERAMDLKLNVVGVSFHIGSSCEDYQTYCEAIEVSRQIFEIAEMMGFKFHILDIGGGFPGNSFTRIDEFCGMINKSLDDHFPPADFPDLKIFAEPGRYFVESAFTLVSKIHSRKVSENATGDIDEVMYYLNEGVYSNFLYLPLENETVEPKILKENQSTLKYQTTIWGPTCDSTDVVCKDIQLELLNIGDIIYFINMGAYTIPLWTPFNGFDKTKVLSFIDFNDCIRLDFSMFEICSNGKATNGRSSCEIRRSS